MIIFLVPEEEKVGFAWAACIDVLEALAWRGDCALR